MYIEAPLAGDRDGGARRGVPATAGRAREEAEAGDLCGDLATISPAMLSEKTLNFQKLLYRGQISSIISTHRLYFHKLKGFSKIIVGAIIVRSPCR